MLARGWRGVADKTVGSLGLLTTDKKMLVLLPSGSAMPASAETGCVNATPGPAIRVQLVESMDPRAIARAATTVIRVIVPVPEGSRVPGHFRVVVCALIDASSVGVFVVNREGDTAEERFVPGVVATAEVVGSKSEQLPPLDLDAARARILATVTSRQHRSVCLGTTAAASLLAGADKYLEQVEMLEHELDLLASDPGPELIAVVEQAQEHRANGEFAKLPEDIRTYLESALDLDALHVQCQAMRGGAVAADR